VDALKEQVLLHADPYLGQIDILTSMKRVSVFIAIAIIGIDKTPGYAGET
jgi:hypothetical protein